MTAMAATSEPDDDDRGQVENLERINGELEAKVTDLQTRLTMMRALIDGAPRN